MCKGKQTRLPRVSQCNIPKYDHSLYCAHRWPLLIRCMTPDHPAHMCWSVHDLIPFICLFIHSSICPQERYLMVCHGYWARRFGARQHFISLLKEVSWLKVRVPCRPLRFMCTLGHHHQHVWASYFQHIKSS